MKKNLGLFDRFARIILGAILMFTAYVMLNDFWQIVVYIFSAGLAITAGLGFGFFYSFLGINTRE